MLATSIAAARPAVLPLFASAPAPDRVSGLFHAATELARLPGQGRALDSRALRTAMEAAFGASDASGAGPNFTKQSADDDSVVDAEVVDEGPAEESK